MKQHGKCHDKTLLNPAFWNPMVGTGLEGEYKALSLLEAC